MAGLVVHLKRRVRNAETELFEWRRCACRLTEDDTLEIETVDEDDDGEEEEADGGDTTETRNATRVIVDLAWQLHALEQKRKCKTRCELQYACVATGGSPTKQARSEELMAPSPRHCEEWIALVREAEKRAKRRQSIREGTATASAVAAMSALTVASSSCSSMASSPSGIHRQSQAAMTTRPTSLAPSSTSDTRPSSAVSDRVPAKSDATPFDASLSSVSGSSMASSAAPKVTPPSSRRHSQQQQQRPPKPAHRASVLLSQRNRYDAHDDYEDDGDQDDDDAYEQEPPSPVGVARTAPLNDAKRSRRSPPPTHDTTFDADASVDAHHHQYDEFEDEEAEEEDVVYQVERRTKPIAERRRRPSVSSTASAAVARRRKSPPSSPSASHTTASAIHTRHLLSPRPRPLSAASSSSTLSPSRHTLRRPSSSTTALLLPVSSGVPRRLRGSVDATTVRPRRQRPSRGATTSASTSAAAAVAASIQRLRRREARFEEDEGGDSASSVALDYRRRHHLHAEDVAGAGEGDSREELDILRRVEGALRHLEQENARALDREQALARQVAALQDALRVRAAEKTHLETQVQQLARDKDQWRQAAQRAERALGALQDELAIAQEETQLQQSERHRLKHQNKELLSQVHRLDAIVYGRF